MIFQDCLLALLDVHDVCCLGLVVAHQPFILSTLGPLGKTLQETGLSQSPGFPALRHALFLLFQIFPQEGLCEAQGLWMLLWP